MLHSIVLGALGAALVFGLVTLYRMIKRNESTDRLKRALDTVRQAFQDYLDPNQVLVGYYPFGVPREEQEDGKTTNNKSGSKKPEKPEGVLSRSRTFGGLTHTVASINSVVFGALVASALHALPIEYRPRAGLLFVFASFAVAISLFVQVKLINSREEITNEKLRKDDPSHAGGVVFDAGRDGSITYLIVHPKEKPTEWVLPKGHIRDGEGHAEAALREVCEEAGIVARIVCPIGFSNFNVKDDDTGKSKEVRVKFYLMQRLLAISEGEKREPSWHDFEQARIKLTYDENREILGLAEAKRRSGFSIQQSST